MQSLAEMTRPHTMNKKVGNNRGMDIGMYVRWCKALQRLTT